MLINDEIKRKYISRLQKRADHLTERTNKNPSLSYDRAELNALKWAIKTLTDIYNL